MRPRPSLHHTTAPRLAEAHAPPAPGRWRDFQPFKAARRRQAAPLRAARGGGDRAGASRQGLAQPPTAPPPPPPAPAGAAPAPAPVPAAVDNEEEAEVLIELRDVHKSFGPGKAVLQGANIKVRRGEAVGIIGGSGTGKSTTLRLMAGLLAPDRGEVRILGQTRHGLLADDPALSERLTVGMVFQNGALFDSLSVGDNVGFLLREHTRLPPARIKELVAASLASVGLSGVEGLAPAELSGGMRKRVALARAIVRDDAHTDAEQVIMYDEPTAGLDPVASTVVEDLIRALHAHSGGNIPATPAAAGTAAPAGANGAPPPPPASGRGLAAYIVVTHQHSTIRRAVDRLIFLHEARAGALGQVVWEGTVEEFDTTDEPIVRQFASGSLQGPIKYE